MWNDLAARTLLVEAGFVLDDTSPDGPWVVLPDAVGPERFATALDNAAVMLEARKNALAIAEAISGMS